MTNESPLLNGLNFTIPIMILIRGRGSVIRGLHWEGLGLVFELSGFFVGSTGSGPLNYKSVWKVGPLARLCAQQKPKRHKRTRNHTIW